MTTSASVDTKSAPRRDLRFGSIEDIIADLDAIEAAHAAGTLTTTGNWSPGQIFTHLAVVVDGALDGSKWVAPMPMRVVASLLFKKKALASDDKMPAGFKLPKSAGHLIPDTSATFEDGMQLLRKGLERVTTGGERFTQPNPVFGKLSHDEWCTIQCKHCGLHLSFLQLA